MSVWSRIAALFGTGASRDSLPPFDTLVDDPQRSATQLGGAPLITPWSAGRLAVIFQDYERQRSHGSLMEARLARQCLSQFWLVAPVDQLEILYQSPIGESYRQLLAGPLPQEALLGAEKGWKDSLAQHLMTFFERPETTNVLLAAMPYFAPGKMRVADPVRQVPDWLQEDYARLFDPELLQRIWKPMGLLAPSGQGYGQAPRLGVQPATQPPSAPQSAGSAVPALPRLSRARGAEALALVESPEYLSRMTGLLNLYVIDPDDRDVQQPLVELRRLMGQIWLDASPAQLEELYATTSFGKLYRDLLTSGFPRAPLSQEDRFLRSNLAQFVADMSRPAAINTLLAALPFYPPGKIAFNGGEHHIPAWLLQEVATLYGETPAPASDEIPAK